MNFIILYITLSLIRLAKSLNLSKLNFYFLLILIQGFAGLIIVDNMHFQYNTLLFGIFFYSLALVFSENFIAGAIVYTILLNMKHIFIYVVKFIFISKINKYIFNRHRRISYFI